MSGAAFFDLDRTLLAGPSGPALSAALRRAGLAPREVPGERFVYGIFTAVGESLPSIALARQAANLARGKARAAVQAAAAEAATVLAAAVQPWANQLFEEHRAAGRPIVMATTTPYDMIKPLADLLGFDDVIATRYGVTANGLYDGSIDGNFVWARGKLDAVKGWAEAHGIDLAQSWAYSDSVYDTPLLSSVGNPVAVNPDPRLALFAIARRWPTVHLDVPPGVPKVLGVEPQQVALAATRLPLAFPYCRFDIDGVEHLPRSGAAIVCANHRSYFDVAAMGVLVGRSGRTVRFLGKKEVFDAPVVGQLATAMGGIRVDRGTGSDEPLLAAAAALQAGEVVAIMPQGTIPRGRAFFEPKLVGRWGAARLAALTGAPVIPVGLWGTEKVWPRNQMVPQVWNVVEPPTVRVRVGKPVKMSGTDLDADTKKLMRAIVKLLPDEARERREPTPEELAATLPRGYRGDPDAEVARRPGTD